MVTRVYFYPERPMDIHPLLQTHSVVYGASDHTLHSCANGGGEFYNPEIIQMFKKHLSSFNSESGTLIAGHHFFKTDGKMVSISGNERDEDLGMKLSDSIFGETRFTKEKYLHFMGLIPKMAQLRSKIESAGWLENCWSLVNRFIYFNYVRNKNDGLVNAGHPNTFDRIINPTTIENKLDRICDKIEEVVALNKICELIERDVDVDDAINKSMDEKTRRRVFGE